MLKNCKVTIVGKYPPIQGGVSSSVFWTAHELARGRFDVQIVTNAEEVEGGFRTVLEKPHSAKCLPLNGTVKVHATAPLKRGSYIPWSNPFASKLLGLTLEAAREQNSDVLVGWYFEPYGIVAALAGLILNKPVVLRHAGSDLGRLSLHPDLKFAYSWMLKSATHVLTSPGLDGMLHDLGASKDKIRFIGAPRIPELFAKPDGPLDVNYYANAFEEWASHTEIPKDLTEAVQANNRKCFDLGHPV
ncbi:MAG: hypothetical protein ABL962_20935, partial [Fimbriimonadaceae bacterium]